jgi:murein DD-endopeptidase MepM/ murein hydrolase activator NlpD
MNFWDYLNWLWDKIEEVLLWFGSLFSTLFDGALNAWNYAVGQATKAFNNAKSWVIAQAYALASDITAVWGWITTQVKAIWNGILAALSTAENWAAAVINTAITWTSTQINNAIAWAEAQLIQLDATLTAWATNLVNAARQEAQNLFAPLLPLIYSVAQLLALANPVNFSNLVTFSQGVYSSLLTFFDDPVGFILSLIWPQIIEFVSFALAYALGATGTTLPPVPQWGKHNSTPPGTAPPPGSNPGLGDPVTPLWVSGNTFGNPPGHYGTDFGITMGQNIYAAHDGVIQEAGWSNVGYGFDVVINGSPYWSRYGHNQQILVTVGQGVTRGQVIAYGDSTGDSTGPHCHFELKVNGSFVDPVLYLPG